ncbi:MAG: crossover junction endodeoxyribonuclease RuvC [Proteobacteria bacterium]|jgi:crossover junction endodeoxyribonuclease RuvC|nr:crossover junction endodeoxyribonuclease RuvC [Pseudomonadota bacterium]MBK9253075.1 crossover junction endodeoxyribonuclease RuvC [Pseudomonadota bacterium]
MARSASRAWRQFDPAEHRLVSERAGKARPAKSAQPAAARVPAPFPRRVLGLDPGSLRTGFGIIDCTIRTEKHVASGCIRATGDDFASRLRQIHVAILELVAEYRPDEVAVEQVFMHRNADSALKLGQARGAALCAAVVSGAAVYEYAPRAIKLAVVGTGAADKAQVSTMVQAMLAICEPDTADASDALAVALCHGQVQRSALRLLAARVAR